MAEAGAPERSCRFQPVEHGSAEYAAECALRQKVLREPLGLDLYAEDLEAERAQLHFGIFEQGEIVACAVVIVENDGSARIRQMAVCSDYQRCGLGTMLIREVEQQMLAKKVRKIVLHARIEAVPFYNRLGYRVTGEQFLEVGIPHLRMEKGL